MCLYVLFFVPLLQIKDRGFSEASVSYITHLFVRALFRRTYPKLVTPTFHLNTYIVKSLLRDMASTEELQATMEQQQAELKAIIEQYASAGAQPQAAPGVDSVAIRLPNFWTTSPELWFAQTEASFDNRSPKITTDGSKYNHVLQALPQDVLDEVELAVSTVGANRYETLKTALIKSYGKSTAKKSAELLAMIARPGNLGDRKPTNLMMKIRKLSGSSYDAVERAIFLGQMPVEVRTALASSKARTNDELCEEADAVVEEFRLANESRGAPHAAAVDIPEVDASFRPRGPPQRSNRDVQPSVSNDRREGLCFLHKKYGVHAYTCRSASCPMKNQVTPRPGNGRAGR